MEAWAQLDLAELTKCAGEVVNALSHLDTQIRSRATRLVQKLEESTKAKIAEDIAKLLESPYKAVRSTALDTMARSFEKSILR
eukprot:2378060-Prymnesium_polylepis.1